MSYIKINNLNYWYPGEKKKTLNNINFELERGELLFLMGKSGSGKSTLGRCLNGSIPNFYGGTVSGEIIIDEIKLKDIDQGTRAQQVTMVFQDPERQLLMNIVHGEIAFGLENIGLDSRQIKRRVWEALQFSNIMDLAYRNINSLSGGEKQKVAICSALAYLPKVIILDEPTSQLDPAASEEVVQLIKKINEELGITIVVIEQRIDKWFDIADNIAIMEKGSINFYGSKKKLYEHHEKNLNSYLPAYLKLSKLLGIEKIPENIKTARKQFEKLKKRSNANSGGEDSSNKSTDENAIEVKRLSCRYDNSEVLKDFSLSVNTGEFVGVLGANGAGKSTLLKCLMNLKDYNGNIKILDRDTKKLKVKELARNIGYVSQNPNDYISKYTVRDELKFTLDNHGIQDNDAIDNILKELELYELKEKNPRDLSGGERQRVALASILVLKPKILLLDEPTRGLDYDAKIKLGKILKKLNENGTTILLVTHDIGFAAEFCSKYMIMFNGEKVAYGDRKEVLAEGIYYTTVINKLFRSIDEDIFTINDFKNRYIEVLI